MLLQNSCTNKDVYKIVYCKLITITNVIQPLYVRYDPNPIPGLCGMYPLYLSKHPVSNTRWRILPIQRPNITRFEEEGQPVNVSLFLEIVCDVFRISYF